MVISARRNDRRLSFGLLDYRQKPYSSPAKKPKEALEAENHEDLTINDRKLDEDSSAVPKEPDGCRYYKYRAAGITVSYSRVDAVGSLELCLRQVQGYPHFGEYLLDISYAICGL